MKPACNFPKLPHKYDRALREAVSFVLEQFKPIGIIAAGTIVRGTPDAASDLDVWVIHLTPMRQRLQKFFHGVPAEIFVNPPWVIRKYFVQDQGEARPISAHMMATGTVVLATDPVVEELRQTAISLVSSSPTVTPQSSRRRSGTDDRRVPELISRRGAHSSEPHKSPPHSGIFHLSPQTQTRCVCRAASSRRSPSRASTPFERYECCLDSLT